MTEMMKEILNSKEVREGIKRENTDIAQQGTEINRLYKGIRKQLEDKGLEDGTIESIMLDVEDSILYAKDLGLEYGYLTAKEIYK